MKQYALNSLILLLAGLFFWPSSATPAKMVNEVARKSHELVFVPSGRINAFWLSREFKADKKNLIEMVEVRAFKAMSKPVSQKQFQAFLREKPEWSRERASQLFVDSSYLSDEGPSDDLPITSVSWFSSRAYCEHYQMRLPTLIEWEYMASFPSKSGQMNSSDVILKWYTEPKGVSKNRIGSTFENQLGIWDLHGLVWEWIEDFNSIFVVSENRDPSSKDLNKFCGAGSLGLSDREDYASYMRFAFRSALKGRSSVWNLGFRCVVD